MTNDETRMTNQCALLKSSGLFMQRVDTIIHGYHPATRVDAVAGGVGQEGPAGRLRRYPGVLVQILQTRLHPAPAPGDAGIGAVLQDRRPRHRRAPGRPLGPARDAGLEEAAPPHHAVPGPQTPGQKGGLEGLLDAVFTDAHRRGIIDPRPQAAIDSTGWEASVRSAHYARRLRDGNRRYRKRKFPKLTIVCHTQSHLIASALATVGPSYDAPLFEPAMIRASWNLDADRLLADAGYDSEPNHRLARQGLGIRSTVIALNRRGRFRADTGGRRRLPVGTYRRQMARRFHRRKYGQRWQVESVISRMKRRLGSALRGRTDAARQRESDLRVFTHNLMILAGSSP